MGWAFILSSDFAPYQLNELNGRIRPTQGRTVNSLLLLDFELCFLLIRRHVSKTQSKDRTKSAYALRLYAGFQQNCETGRYGLMLTDVYLKTLQEDGSLVAWDLREPLSMHYMSKISVGDNEIILRSPTFSTGGSPVVT